jgi:hypothetical protein
MQIVKPCRLCGLDRVLRRSHILPEFVYKATYDESHKAVLLDPVREQISERQQGFVERMLCATCEGHFSRWETYVARVWLHPSDQKRPRHLVPGTHVVVTGLDYRRFKLFMMSTLWRMSVATDPVFSAVRLGNRVEDLRSLLLESEPGDVDAFAFAGCALFDSDTGAWKDEIFIGPHHAKVNGQSVYTVVFGGVRWVFFASKHTRGRSSPPALSLDGHLRLFVEDWQRDPFIQASAPDLGKLDKSHPALRRVP